MAPQAQGKSSVDEVLFRKYELQKWKMGLMWALLNLTLALLCYIDLQAGYLLSWSPLLWYVEMVLGVVFTLNFTSDLFTYFRVFGCSPLDVSTSNRQLLGIRNSDESFKTTPDSDARVLRSSSTSPSTTMDPSVFLTTSTPTRHATNPSTSQLWTSSPFSPSFSASPNDSSRLSSTSASSWAYFEGSSTGKLHKPLLSTSASPMEAEDIVTDEKSFLKYLESKEEREHKFLASLEGGGGGGVGNSSASLTGGALWGGANHSEHSSYSASAAKLSYQLSPRNPQSSTSRTESTDTSLTSHGKVVWSKVGVSPDQVFVWMEKLRKWLNKTILSRLVAEIDSVNESLRRQGTPDVQIGEVGLPVLRQRSKGPQISSLYTLLQYLEATPNQEYFVQRIRELEKGGCISDFRWDSGGSFKGKPWADHLPTDSELIMHLFLTYLDSRSPVHSSFPEGRPVTNRYFCRSLDKTEGSVKESVCIYQSKLNPPHYKLLVGEETWELNEGRNNLFHAILLFLYQLKTKEDGMLNHINLGPSGLNLLWILEQ